MRPEYDSLTYHIGGDYNVPFSKVAWKAYFIWKKGDMTVETQAFDRAELPAEIQRRKELGEDVTTFERAYTKWAWHDWTT